MIVREFYRTRKDGVNLYKSYSDKGVMIQKVGTDEIYDVAIDVSDAFFVYIETNQPIPKAEPETEALADSEIVSTEPKLTNTETK